MNASRAVDERWALRLQCDADELRKPGLRVIRGKDLDRPIFMRYVVPFFALLPAHTPNSLTLVSTNEICDEVLSWDLDESALSSATLEPRLLQLAESMRLEDAFVFDILTADPEQLTLSLSRDVTEVAPESAEAVDWEGKRLETEVDGAIFVLRDELGTAAWAGEKLTSDVARDIQVATRPDRRQLGLASQVASHAINAIVQRGITPYYSHLRGNTASARLAKSLGFVPYGSAVLAEYQARVQ